MDPVQAFLQANSLTPPAFPATSRYYGIPTSQRVQADGRTVVYVQRRFLPPPENFAPLQIVHRRRRRPARQPRRALPRRSAAVVAALRCQPRDAAGGARRQRRAPRLTITLPEGVPGVADGD